MAKNSSVFVLGDADLVKADVGLGNVDNTADAAKPVSTAQQTALDTKQASGSYATAAQGTTADAAQPGDAQLTALAGLAYAGNTLKVVRVNAAETGFELAAPGGGVAWGNVTGTLSAQTDLQSALDGKQVSGTYASGTGSASGTNTGDNAVNTLYSGLVSNATHTGDATGATALTVVKINGVSMSGLATGILKNTTTTGVPSIAVNSDLPVMTATVGGAVPTPPNNTTTFLRGDGTFAAPPGGASINTLRTTSNQTINAGAGVFVDITGLTFPVVSGTSYAFDFYITFQSSAATTGWKAGVNCPTGTLDFWAGSDVIANGAAGVATHTERHNTVRDDMTLLTATITQAVDLNVRIRGRYLCTANGTFAARFANELSPDTNIVVQNGSWGMWF